MSHLFWKSLVLLHTSKIILPSNIAIATGSHSRKNIFVDWLAPPRGLKDDDTLGKIALRLTHRAKVSLLNRS
jgi:hypothetical protein